MQLQSILNVVERHPSFVYESVSWADDGTRTLEIHVRARRRSRPVCSGCGKRSRTYDHRGERRFQFVPLWGIVVFFLYAPRRVDCPKCGVTIERLPWATGKERTTTSFQWFLARWAKRLSWSETGAIFGVSWDTVRRAVMMAVSWGLRHRDLDNIEAIGIDEVAYQKGHKYLTLAYQIDHGARRLLWIGDDRKKRTLRKFFRFFGKRRLSTLKYICSDMCNAYLSVIAAEAGQVVHILDRFHIVQLFNKAIDKVRAEEARRLKKTGVNVLKNSRWLLLKRRGRLSRKEVFRLKDLIASNLKTVKCYLMKEDFQRLWDYKAPWRIAAFFVDWIERAKRTQIEPMLKVAETLDRHSELIFNWFTAKGEISAGAVEGMNLKVKLTTRRSYGFRGKETLKLALYHNLGQLPEPTTTHQFC